jgi:hypothetical protein
LALENAILRTGVVMALENSDLWLAYDNPSLPAAERPLYGMANDSAGKQRGLPFTPFKTSQPITAYRASSVAPIVPVPLGISKVVRQGLDEHDGGWEPNSWHAAEARGWTWGNLAERTPLSTSVAPGKFKTFGRYEWLASTDPAFSPHSWQQRQLDGLNRSLGYYGLFDYLPANTGMMISEKLTSGTYSGTWITSAEWCDPNSGPFYRLAHDANLTFTLDRLSDTWGQVFVMPNKSVTLANRSRVASRRYSTGIAISMSANNNSVNDIKQMLIDAEEVDDVLHEANATMAANKPDTWPSLSVSNLRFIRTGAFINLNRITWVSPLTGKGTELSFSCFGTTLRGARQQRLRDAPGWADPFPLSGGPNPHLDSY